MPRAARKKSKGFPEWEWPLELDRKRPELGSLSLSELSKVRFEDLGQFKQAEAFPHGYDRDYLTFYAPRDTGVHQVLLWALLQAKSSVAINMYGFADGHMASLLRHYAHDEKMMVTLSLDSTEAGVGSAPEILATLKNELKGNSIAIGRSEGGDISHNKLMVVDGLYLVSGSTNWSIGGETKQDNQLTLSRDPIACAEARAVIDLNHDFMLKKMAAKAQEEAEKAGKAKATKG